MYVVMPAFLGKFPSISFAKYCPKAGHHDLGWVFCVYKPLWIKWPKKVVILGLTSPASNVMNDRFHGIVNIHHTLDAFEGIQFLGVYLLIVQLVP